MMVVAQWLVVVVCVVIGGALALVMDIREVMLTSSPKLQNWPTVWGGGDPRPGA